MRTEVFKALIQNSSILVVAFLLVTRFSRWRMLKGRLKSNLIQGFAYALCGVLAIMFSVEVESGVMIDMRTPIIVIAALTGGPVVGAITILPLMVYRAILGGTGMHAGFGIIVSAMFLGLVLRAYENRRGKPGGYLFQTVAGVASAVVYYIWILTLPEDIALPVLKQTMLPLTAGSVLSLMVIFLIRKREAAQGEMMAKLSEINDLFEEISLDENIGITVLQSGRIAYINGSLLRKFGYSGFDPENSDLLDILSPCNRGFVSEFLEEVRQGKGMEARPMELSVPGRGSLTFLIHARNLIYKGTPSILVVSVDITALVETERTLEKRVEQLQISLDASGAVLWRADLKADRLLADSDFFDLLAYHPEEDPPLFSHWLFVSELSPEVELAFQNLQGGLEDSVFGELSLTGSDGAKRWFNTGARLTGKDDRGLPSEITGILYETTGIKEKELDLMEKEIEELQSRKMETVGRLAGGVAHDFNNLLHVIMGYTEILAKVTEDDPVTSELAAPIMDASRKGRELVRQLLLFSRNKTPEMRRVDLREVTGNFIRLLGRIMEENILITSDLSGNAPVISGDAGQIEQVLMNLCVNSRDAMPQGGEIMVSLEEFIAEKPVRLLTGTLQPGRYSLVTVADTGPGIPPERHSSVFEPFYTTKQINRGSGLGLATVMGIMEAHSGVIHLDNRRSGGLEVSLYLPAAREAAGCTAVPGVPSVSPPRPGLSSLTVLVAEDDPGVRNLAVEGLGTAGIRVLTASDGAGAVDVFSSCKEKIDLFIFDVVMPGLSGPEALGEIRKMGGDQPVIFTTGYAGDKLRDLSGSFIVVDKPYAISDLVSKIGELIEKGRAEHD